jgi:hypothetical protein
MKRNAPKNMKLFKLDVDDNADIAQCHCITCVPTFLFYYNGDLLTEWSFSGADEKLLKVRYEGLRDLVKK